MATLDEMLKREDPRAENKMGVPPWIRTKKQLADYIKASKGGSLNKEDWYALLAANPHLKGGGKKRKRRSYKKGYKRGAKRARRAMGSGAPGTRPIVMQPNIVGYGPYHYTDSVSGLGGYEVTRNSLMGAVDLGSSPPTVRNTHKGEAVVLGHREFLGDLYTGTNGTSSSPFNLIDALALNPGNPALFPWLAPIGQMFQEYEVRGMLVELKTLSSDYAAQLSIGSMFMAADYNVLGNPPPDKRHLENMEYASSCKPSCSLIMPIECEPRNDSNTHLYVAKDRNYEGGDRRLYDLCNIYIGSEGVPVPQDDNPVKIAEIWVTYEIALFKPIIPDALLGVTLGGHWQLSNVSDQLLTNVTFADPQNSDEFTVYNTGQIHLPQQENVFYYIAVMWTANASTGDFTGGIPALTDCAFGSPAWGSIPPRTNLFANNTGNDATYFNTCLKVHPQAELIINFIVNVTGPNPVVDLNPVGGTITVPAGAIFGDIFICQMPSGITT